MKYQLNKYHLNIPDQELLVDLKKVALKLGKNKITQREYLENGEYSSTTIAR